MNNHVPMREPPAEDIHAVRSLMDEVDQLLAQSSLGTEEALELRRETPPWLVRKIAERCEEDPSDANGDLSGIDYRDGCLAGMDLTGADLSGAQLQKTDLSRANLAGADLSEAQLEQVDLSYANLEGAILVGASLNRALLRGAKLDGASLFRAKMDGVRILDTSLRYTCLRKAVLRGAIFGQVDLTGADLGEACLKSVVVAGAVLAEAELTDATFHDAHLGHVDLTSCVGLERRQLLFAQLEDNVVVPPEWPHLRRRRSERTSNSHDTTALAASSPHGPPVHPPPPVEQGERIPQAVDGTYLPSYHHDRMMVGGPRRPGTVAGGRHRTHRRNLRRVGADISCAAFLVALSFLVVAGAIAAQVAAVLPQRAHPASQGGAYAQNMVVPPVLPGSATCPPETWHRSCYPGHARDRSLLEMAATLRDKHLLTLRVRPVGPGVGPEKALTAPRGEGTVVQVRNLATPTSSYDQGWEEFFVRTLDTRMGKISFFHNNDSWSTLEVVRAGNHVSFGTVLRELTYNEWTRVEVQPLPVTERTSVEAGDARTTVIQVRIPADRQQESPYLTVGQPGSPDDSGRASEDQSSGKNDPPPPGGIFFPIGALALAVSPCVRRHKRHAAPGARPRHNTGRCMGENRPSGKAGPSFLDYTSLPVGMLALAASLYVRRRKPIAATTYKVPRKLHSAVS